MAIAIGTCTSVGHNGAHIHSGGAVIYVVSAGNNATTTPSVDSATFGGVAMTRDVGSYLYVWGADREAIAIFRLNGVVAGSATAAATVTNGGINKGYCISLPGIDSANPVVAIGGGDGVYAATLNSKPGGIAIAGVANRTNGVTPASGLTELIEIWTGGADHGFAVGYELNTGTSETLGWDAHDCVGAFVTYKAAPSGNQVIWL